MKICKYGITLSRLRQEDIEFVRQKRNSEQVRQFMEFREEITPEMQQRWFDGINNFENFYYIIDCKGIKIGLLNDKNMDWSARTSESGLFLWDVDYINTIIPVLASLCLLEAGFYFLNWNTSYIKVLRDNPKAIQYVTGLGYRLCEGQEGVSNQAYFLTKELFDTKGRDLQRAARAFIDDESGDGYMILEAADYSSGFAKIIEDFFMRENLHFLSEIVDGGKKFYR